MQYPWVSRSPPIRGPEVGEASGGGFGFESKGYRVPEVPKGSDGQGIDLAFKLLDSIGRRIHGGPSLEECGGFGVGEALIF